MINFAYASAKKISSRNANQLSAFNSQASNLQELKKNDPIIESIKMIENAAKKRHTENIRGLAGFNSYFKDFHSSGMSGDRVISSHKID